MLFYLLASVTFYLRVPKISSILIYQAHHICPLFCHLSRISKSFCCLKLGYLLFCRRGTLSGKTFSLFFSRSRLSLA